MPYEPKLEASIHQRQTLLEEVCQGLIRLSTMTSVTEISAQLSENPHRQAWLSPTRGVALRRTMGICLAVASATIDASKKKNLEKNLLPLGWSPK